MDNPIKYNHRIHHRQSMRLKGYDYSSAGLYFVTICIQNYLHLLGEMMDNKMILNDAGEMIQTQWIELSKRFVNIQLHENIVMPNHFHGIIHICSGSTGEPCVRPSPNRPEGTSEGTIGRIIQAFKSITTNEYINGVKQKNWQRFDKKLWQRNYWDHIVRNENEYNQISQYIIDNPAKWQDDKLNGGIGNQVMESQARYGEEIWMV